MLRFILNRKKMSNRSVSFTHGKRKTPTEKNIAEHNAPFVDRLWLAKRSTQPLLEEALAWSCEQEREQIKRLQRGSHMLRARSLHMAEKKEQQSLLVRVLENTNGSPQGQYADKKHNMLTKHTNTCHEGTRGAEF